MNSDNWDDIDLIDINNFIDGVDFDNCQEDPFAFLKSKSPSTGANVDVSRTSATCPENESAETGGSRKRGRPESCSLIGTKACREKLRRDKLNDRFLDLSSVLEPGRTGKADKLLILGDAIRVLNQMKSEVTEYKDMNAKLLEEIQTLRAEKNELREEKLKLKTDKERIEQQLRATAVPPPGFMTPHPAAYHAEMNKLAVFPGYNFMPMFHYSPQSAHDTSRDHEFRPPAA